jgi:DNA-binding GntR family transcriptional regulator
LGSKTYNSNNFKKPKTLTQSIYERLKKSILSKKLEPDQKINEKDIAESFQVSRTPVREAVARLVAEGFVEIISHREAVVKKVSYSELKDIFQVIGVLDRLAVNLIIDQIDSEDLTKLEKMTKKMERYFIMSEVEKFLDLNYAFHVRIWDHLKGKNDFLKDELYSCVNQARMCFYPLLNIFKDPKILKKSMSSHKEIVQALKEKDKAKLETIVYEHWIPPLP